ncbi:protein of unknown function [Pseudomonas sp. JV241A]|nr:protein of unknown function [Pseudomonas sp. JV241A]
MYRVDRWDRVGNVMVTDAEDRLESAVLLRGGRILGA